MSIIAKLFGWTGLPQWAIELIAILLIAGGVVLSYHYTYHKGVVAGKDAEIAAVKAASDKDHAIQQANITKAEQTHETDQLELDAYRATHPDQPVRLCLNSTLPARTVAGKPSSPSAWPGAHDVQPMPAGDPSGGAERAGPDIFGMLDALAARADQVNSDRTELQAIVRPLTK